MRYQTLKANIDNPQRYMTSEHVQKILKAALPHQAKFVDEQDPGSYHYLLDELEASLLSELRNILDGKAADQRAAQHAKEIMSVLNVRTR
jgi:hypothetical protein